MLRSMYAGISGMKANQTKMDVVGNNVANVGTTSFKKSSTRFSDALYQTTLYASAPGGGIGGVNPGQVGIGTKVSGIGKNMLQGAIQPTGRPTDFAIDGDGFFTVKISDKQNAYTRDGSFSLDKEGYVVTSGGYRVLGQQIDDKGKVSPNLVEIQVPKEIYFTKDAAGKEVPVDKKDLKKDLQGNLLVNANGNYETTAGTEVITKKVLSFNISKDGKVSYLLNDGTKSPKMDANGDLIAGETQQQLKIGVFQNPEGLESLGGNLYGISANSGEPVNTNVFGKINQGAIEMANVDLSEEFTEMIVTTRAFQASSKVITTSDELLQEIINLKR